MTHSGGKPHAVGDRGQRFEVTYLDPGSNTRKVFGWSKRREGAEDMAGVIEAHPSMAEPKVRDRTPDQPDICMRSGFDRAGIEKVEALIEQVKAAGLPAAAEMFANVYWGWLRAVCSYRFGLPYVEKPEEGSGMTPYSALHVTTSTITHWATKIPGTPIIDNEAVRRDGEVDDEWHRQEDRRMRRAAGEPA